MGNPVNYLGGNAPIGQNVGKTFVHPYIVLLHMKGIYRQTVQ